jgi:acyl-CoA thioesterase
VHGEGQVRSAKGRLWASGTHFLSSTRRGLIRTAKEIQQARDTHVLSNAVVSAYQDGEESQSARATHFLSRTEGATHQDSKKKLESEGHSLAVEYKQKYNSGQQKKTSEHGALTCYEAQRDTR